MSNKLFGAIIFAAGAAIGSAVTWCFLKKKYELIAQDEIDSVKELYSTKEKKVTQEKPNLKEYAEKLNSYGYTRKSEPAPPDDKPYIITPEEAGDADAVDAIFAITYYADGVLADENGDIFDEVDKIGGIGVLKHFGEYEEDSVFVRNPILKCDYEILYDLQKYSDLIKNKPKRE